MKRFSALPFALFAFAAVIMSSPVQAKAKPVQDEAAETADAGKSGKKSETVVTVEGSMEKVHTAALEALATIGCEIKKDKPTAIEAKRPNKIGLAVGSGGEKLFVTLRDAGEGKVEVLVRTKKTMLGIVGQKLWNDDVAAKIQSALQ